ncbi:Glutamyl-tRNA reductase [Pedobacter sp. Bi27]|uniref:glutamyl-tRNA reductase n=1 Tax=unclassified Pedobacter TaxID=2628915 RepID=UPI001D44FD29|nr:MULTISPECIES: glutamyl-tRNA reductase [unclassified Pedobacter]CAH0240237.1 Glutamyl-tRNA reductase [Pedobacter sp. Bi27]CAH0253281.1 Glutamyl-tRNA reductase [Pedobacter sp. Bi36]CAH0277926.1 Glutamyl-tRNA reductase [Pedobacter sp. Bi126]
MEYLKVIAFTHHHIDLKSLGKLVICDQSLDSRLKNVQAELPVSEIFYIGTCNRVEFVFLTKEKTDKEFVTRFLTVLDMGLPPEFMERFLDNVTVYENEEAFNHLLRTSCSLESLVVGEKEILAQIRKAYENCRDAGFTGDYMRMIMDRVVKTAKEVYTHTNISKNPVSVVSLAYRKLKELNMCGNSRILIIGAGETNQNIAKYLNKHKYSNFSIFNRTFSKAESLAQELGGKAYPLAALEDFNEGFDVIITCTGSTEAIINEALYAKLLNGDQGKKVIVDLAIPNDVTPAVIHNNPVHYIEVESLKEVARKNIQERYNELVHAEEIISNNITEFFSVLKQRRIELAMQEVPRKIKEIKNTAINGVFADEISQMDEASREVLERVMNYMEKKYISVPMVMAKEILVNQP